MSSSELGSDKATMSTLSEEDLFKDSCDVIHLSRITPRTLGQILIDRCGQEHQWDENNTQQHSTRRFLQAAIDYIPKAIMDHGAELKNASFSFKDSTIDLVVISGDGQWSFEFRKTDNNHFEVTCEEKPSNWWDCWGFLEMLNSG